MGLGRLLNLIGIGTEIITTRIITRKSDFHSYMHNVEADFMLNHPYNANRIINENVSRLEGSDFNIVFTEVMAQRRYRRGKLIKEEENQKYNYGI